MKSFLSLLVLLFIGGTASSHAQVGFGLGVAAIGDNVGQAGGSIKELILKDSIGYGDVSGDIGFYVTGRGRIELGPVRLLGDLSYVYFQAAEITLTDASVNTADSTVNATFEVGTSLIPVYIGASIALDIPVIHPYVGGQIGYTYVNRTYTFLSGSSELNRPEFSNESAGDPEFGVAILAGAEIEIGPALLDIGARYNLSNLLTKDDDEKSMRYLQAGATFFFNLF